MKSPLAALLVLALATTMAPAVALEPLEPSAQSSVEVTATSVTISNGLIERTWSMTPFQTTSIRDLRTGTEWAGTSDDFSLTVGGAELPNLFNISEVSHGSIPDGNGVRLTLELDGPAFDATRTIEVYDGVAGMRIETVLHLTAPLALGGYTLDEVSVADATPTIHAFRAGADWRGWDEETGQHWQGPHPDDSWKDFGGPVSSIGDPHAGTWRDTRTAGPGEDIAGPAQWLSLAKEDSSSLFMVMERNDHPSSRAAYTGGVASLVVDHSRDVLNGGPFEEQIHVENPTPSPGRHRVVGPQDFALEASFLGLGTNPDDEAWQFFKYLTEHRLEPYDFDVTFNSNGTDGNEISTGAKDDLNFETIQEVAPIAKALGVETFILDDGWQAISGDWCPDSPDCPEPRWDQVEGSKFRPRFPDSTFEAVRQEITPMKLGLWMNIMHFHPESATYQTHRDWACHPVGDGLVAYNTAEPESSSNEAGLGTWSPAAIPHVEAAVRTAIDEWDAKYFKFDFLVWLDCVDQGDMYDYRQAFIAMLDRLIDDPKNSDVTFEIDETNDYRLFPFESVTRGPSWFQNGSPRPPQLLHNIWNLSPFIPAFSLGQHSLGGNAYNDYPVDTLMAAALPGHITFFSDIRNFVGKTDVTGAPVVERTGEWMAYYKANRESFTQMIYPLLDDPIEDGWTALQSWNPEEGFGALLSFRQEDVETTTTIGLRNVPAGRTFDLFLGRTKEFIGTFTSNQLTDGITVSLEKREAAVFLIEPHEETP